jgi:hypothetical protein
MNLCVLCRRNSVFRRIHSGKYATKMPWTRKNFIELQAIHFHYNECLLQEEVLSSTNRLPHLDTRTAEKTTRTTVILLLRVFPDAVTFLPGLWISTMGGYTYRHRLMGGIYEVRR